MRRYCDFYTKRRIMDRAVRNIKYNDGIRDILNKMKLKITEFIRLTQMTPNIAKFQPIYRLQWLSLLQLTQHAHSLI